MTGTGNPAEPTSSAIHDFINSSSSDSAVDRPKSVSNVLTYATSKWALGCIAMAVLLNRAYIFAATRRRLALPWYMRLIIRSGPLLLLGLQAWRFLQAIQCQTAPDSAQRWGSISGTSGLLFYQPNPVLHTISSWLLLGTAAGRESCSSANMFWTRHDPSDESQDIRGSLSLLWPLFGTLCLSQLLETIICAVEGRRVSAETGMTLFEHSLAFAEADAAVTNLLAGAFLSAGTGLTDSPMPEAIVINRSLILARANTSPEVLVVALLSTMSHMTSHVLGIFNLQAKFRLLSTTFWGLCFIASILSSVVTFSFYSPGDQSLLQFPTVCVIGFIPHVLVLSGIVVCLSVYAFALVLSALAPPPAEETGSATWSEHLARARGNLQASVSLSDLRISGDLDFYTALLRTGFGAITLASEAVYLNEHSGINVVRRTWLEEQRLQELDELQSWQYDQSEAGPGFGSMRTLVRVPEQDGAAALPMVTGYAREKIARRSLRQGAGSERPPRSEVATVMRRGRWFVAMRYLGHMSRVLLRAWALLISRILAALGVQWQPAWLRWVMRGPKYEAPEALAAATGTGGGSHGPGQRISRRSRFPLDDHVDVEAEVRKHFESSHPDAATTEEEEEEVDKWLYDWWLKGSTWGSVDRSGDYIPSEEASLADDASSVSLSSEDEKEEESGTGKSQRRPSYRASTMSRGASPIVDSPLQLSDLARLLHPRNSKEQAEADTLSAHLGSDEIVTRSRYRTLRSLQLARVLIPGQHAGAAASLGRGKRSAHEEAILLEQILLMKRQPQGVRELTEAPSSWTDGAPGIGQDGPACVVCQTSPRTIIVWPCRCLSLCDDCRVSLAMNNFDKCVCCRSPVMSFSRMFVP